MDKRQILLIDDQTNRCDFFLHALDKVPMMFKCSFAGNTREAIDTIKKITPDYIFLDMSGPGRKDLLCIEAIKKERSIQHIPFYVYATELDPQSAKKAAGLGVLKWIKKPKDVRTLSKIFKGLFYKSMRAEVRNYAPRYNDSPVP